MIEFANITLDIHEGIARLTFARPHTLNSISTAMVTELRKAVHRVAEDQNARVLILTGEGRAFSSGADLSGAGPSTDPSRPRDVGEVVEHFNPLVMELARLEKPIIAAVNGLAVGAGCSLALQGDLIVAARSAYFLQAFTKVGLIPDGGATWMLPRLVGLGRANRMMLLAEKIGAEEAESMGLVAQVVDDDRLDETVTALARTLAAGPTRAYGLARRAIREGLTQDLPASLAQERAGQREAGFTDDYAEGVSAFKEKRPARFTGR